MFEIYDVVYIDEHPIHADASHVAFCLYARMHACM